MHDCWSPFAVSVRIFNSPVLDCHFVCLSKKSWTVTTKYSRNLISTITLALISAIHFNCIVSKAHKCLQFIKYLSLFCVCLQEQWFFSEIYVSHKADYRKPFAWTIRFSLIFLGRVFLQKVPWCHFAKYCKDAAQWYPLTPDCNGSC